jgi:hypothetical protein
MTGPPRGTAGASREPAGPSPPHPGVTPSTARARSADPASRRTRSRGRPTQGGRYGGVGEGAPDDRPTSASHSSGRADTGPILVAGRRRKHQPRQCDSCVIPPGYGEMTRPNRGRERPRAGHAKASSRGRLAKGCRPHIGEFDGDRRGVNAEDTGRRPGGAACSEEVSMPPGNRAAALGHPCRGPHRAPRERTDIAWVFGWHGPCYAFCLDPAPRFCRRAVEGERA